MRSIRVVQIGAGLALAAACGGGSPNADAGAVDAPLTDAPPADGPALDAPGVDGDVVDSGRPPDVDRYEPVEITVTATRPHDNPYLEATLTATVSPPEGSGEAPYTIPGFWDGGDTWRVRWAPRNAGRYTVTLESSDTTDEGLHGRSFTTEVGPDISETWAPHGFVHIDPASRYYLLSDDGSPFLWVGDTNWINLYEHGWDQPLASEDYWRAVCDARAEQGFSVIQAVVYNESVHWEDGEYPFGGDAGSDHDVINPISWQRVDARVQYALQRGLMVYLMTSSNGMHFAWPVEQRERLYRTIVARYAAYNVGFGGGEEVDRGGFGSDDKYRHMIDTLHALDPYRRLVGLHAESRGVKVVPEDVDMLLIQYYTGDISYEESERCSRGYGKPFINAETWYFDNGRPGMDDPASIRRMAWRIYLGGAAGYTYGHMGVVVPTGSSHPMTRELSDLRDGSADEMRKVAVWLREPGLAWWRFSRFESLATGRYLSADPGQQYVIYDEVGGADLQVDLSDASGMLSGQWYDIAADAPGDTITVTAGPDVRVPSPGPWHVLRLDPM